MAKSMSAVATKKQTHHRANIQKSTPRANVIRRVEQAVNEMFLVSLLEGRSDIKPLVEAIELNPDLEFKAKVKKRLQEHIWPSPYLYYEVKGGKLVERMRALSPFRHTASVKDRDAYLRSPGSMLRGQIRQGEPVQAPIGEDYLQLALTIVEINNPKGVCELTPAYERTKNTVMRLIVYNGRDGSPQLYIPLHADTGLEDIKLVWRQIQQNRDRLLGFPKDFRVHHDRWRVKQESVPQIAEQIANEQPEYFWSWARRYVAKQLAQGWTVEDITELCRSPRLRGLIETVLRKGQGALLAETGSRRVDTRLEKLGLSGLELRFFDAVAREYEACGAAWVKRIEDLLRKYSNLIGDG